MVVTPTLKPWVCSRCELVAWAISDFSVTPSSLYSSMKSLTMRSNSSVVFDHSLWEMLTSSSGGERHGVDELAALDPRRLEGQPLEVQEPHRLHLRRVEALLEGAHGVRQVVELRAHHPAGISRADAHRRQADARRGAAHGVDQLGVAGIGRLPLEDVFERRRFLRRGRRRARGGGRDPHVLLALRLPFDQARWALAGGAAHLARFVRLLLRRAQLADRAHVAGGAAREASVEPTGSGWRAPVDGLEAAQIRLLGSFFLHGAHAPGDRL